MRIFSLKPVTSSHPPSRYCKRRSMRNFKPFLQRRPMRNFLSSIIMITRSAKLSEQLKRDGQHETPPASVPEAKSAPGFKLQSQSCRQSSDEVIPEKSANSSNTAIAATKLCHISKENEFDQPVQVLQDYKTPPEPNHQVQPDSEPSLVDGREGSNSDLPRFKHETRPDNSTDFQRDPNTRINFPKSSDVKTWKELDQILSDVLPKIFTARKIRSTTSNELVEEFDDWLHAFFLQHCGPVEAEAVAAPPAKSSKRHRGLERLRRQKNECKKAFKTLKKAGLCQSRAGQAVKTLWLKLIKRHNKLRCKIVHQKSKWKRVLAERKFKQDPHKYAQDLFKGESLNGSPTCTQEEAELYFKKLYHDECRSEDFSPLEGMVRPPLPMFPFFEDPPNFKEVQRHTRSKRNSACPGLNRLPYLIYKKCKAILRTAHRIFLKIFKSKDIPSNWSTAFVVLLQKNKDVLDDPSEFRPIAITNTLGKIFFSIISARLQKFMVKNNYIKTIIQKGFLFGVPGCVEHSFSLWEALREAKDEQRAIVLSWLDLANAYGSVMHNLIQFALNWYHVPLAIQQLIFDYYEKLRAKVTTKTWSTGFFFFDIGLFQGCVLSTILFDCVFNLLLDFLDPLKHEGYTFKTVPVTIMHKAYADDLQFSTTTPRGHQRVLNKTMIWLDWTKTMRAKPKKCVSLAWRQFKRGAISKEGYVPVSDTIYSAYDPLLLIDGKPLNFIEGINSDHEFLARHFKFLGRWISSDLDDEATKRKFEADFFKWLALVDKDLVNGLMKLWIYQHYIIAKSSWPLLVHDFNRDFAVKIIQQPTGVYLRRWAGLYKSADIGTLYRPRELLGLNLTSVTVHFERMRVIRCHLLKHSADKDVATVYQHRVNRFKDHGTIWRDTQLLEKVESMVAHESKFQSAAATDKRGLGHNLFVAHLDNDAEHRKRCGAAVRLLDTEGHMAHAAQLALQSVWTHWADKSSPFDLSWRNLIWGPGPRIISFVLNATINSLPTPSMLHLWGYTPEEKCGLCGAEKCTLFHILVGCDKALTDKRYTWRHDSVLATMLQILVRSVIRHNASKLVPDRPAPIAFVSAGKAAAVKKHTPTNSKSLLKGANDWQLLIDFDKCRMLFPPIIVATSERPDVVLWSARTKSVILGELTCPAEENFSKANTYKMDRYAILCEQIRDAGWKVSIRTFEAGARGFVGHRFPRFLRELGLSSKEARQACKDISLVTARCSYGIYLMRKTHIWNVSRELVVPNHFLQPPPFTTPYPLLADLPARDGCDWHTRLGLPPGDLLAVSIASATAAAAAATATSAKAKAYARAAVRAAKAASALADNAGKPRGTRPLALRPAANPRASLTFGPTCVHKPKRKRRCQRRQTPGYLTVFLVPEDSIPRLQ